jgi:hypothetical protein
MQDLMPRSLSVPKEYLAHLRELAARQDSVATMRGCSCNQERSQKLEERRALGSRTRRVTRSTRCTIGCWLSVFASSTTYLTCTRSGESLLWV